MDKEAPVRRCGDLAFVNTAVSRLARVDFQAPILVSVAQSVQITRNASIGLVGRGGRG